jgi:putative transposase
MAARMTSQLAVDAQTNAIALRRPTGTVVHSDRGSQFRSHTFVQTLRRNSVVGSMGRVGTCADNAAMESFLQPAAEERPEPPPLDHPRTTPPGDHHTYHRRRRQDTLGRFTPIEYQTHLQAAHAALTAPPIRVNRTGDRPSRLKERTSCDLCDKQAVMAARTDPSATSTTCKPP